MADPPRSAMTASTSALEDGRSATETLNPSATSLSAMARPIPRAAPVTSAERLSRSLGCNYQAPFSLALVERNARRRPPTKTDDGQEVVQIRRSFGTPAAQLTDRAPLHLNWRSIVALISCPQGWLSRLTIPPWGLPPAVMGSRCHPASCSLMIGNSGQAYRTDRARRGFAI